MSEQISGLARIDAIVNSIRESKLLDEDGCRGLLEATDKRLGVSRWEVSKEEDGFQVLHFRKRDGHNLDSCVGIWMGSGAGPKVYFTTEIGWVNEDTQVFREDFEGIPISKKLEIAARIAFPPVLV